MRSEVTELTPEEQDYARSRPAQLAEQFTVDGALRSPQWEQVFRRTWRHPYVPCYYLDHGAGPLISAADEQHRSQWLAGVYSDQTLVTKTVPMPGRSEAVTFLRRAGYPVRVHDIGSTTADQVADALTSVVLGVRDGQECYDVAVKKVTPHETYLELSHYDAVGFSLASSATYGFMREARDRSAIRKNALVMVGGVHRNFYPLDTLSDFRAHVAADGESEETILEILERADTKRFDDVAGVYWRLHAADGN